VLHAVELVVRMQDQEFPTIENDLEELSGILAHRDLPAGVRDEAAVDDIGAPPAGDRGPLNSRYLL